MIYVAITFCPFVSLEQRALALVLFSYLAAKQWNALPDCNRTNNFTEFKRNIQGMTFVFFLLFFSKILATNINNIIKLL